MNASKRLVRDGWAARSCRYFIRLAMLPWHQLRAATGMLLMTATRCRAEAKTAAPWGPTCVECGDGVGSDGVTE